MYLERNLTRNPNPKLSLTYLSSFNCYFRKSVRKIAVWLELAAIPWPLMQVGHVPDSEFDEEFESAISLALSARVQLLFQE